MKLVRNPFARLLIFILTIAAARIYAKTCNLIQLNILNILLLLMLSDNGSLSSLHTPTNLSAAPSKQQQQFWCRVLVLKC
jgi:hypothetical protein